jgi:hypothetical protein
MISPAQPGAAKIRAQPYGPRFCVFLAARDPHSIGATASFILEPESRLAERRRARCPRRAALQLYPPFAR